MRPVIRSTGAAQMISRYEESSEHIMGTLNKQLFPVSGRHFLDNLMLMFLMFLMMDRESKRVDAS